MLSLQTTCEGFRTYVSSNCQLHCHVEGLQGTAVRRSGLNGFRLDLLSLQPGTLLDSIVTRDNETVEALLQPLSSNPYAIVATARTPIAQPRAPSPASAVSSPVGRSSGPRSEFRIFETRVGGKVGRVHSAKRESIAEMFRLLRAGLPRATAEIHFPRLWRPQPARCTQILVLPSGPSADPRSTITTSDACASVRSSIAKAKVSRPTRAS